MYATSTPPAMVPMPAVISAKISLRVIRPMYGFTISGDSVWPRKIEAAAASDSAPESFMNFRVTQAKAHTTFCKTPQ